MKYLLPLILLASCGESYEPGYKSMIVDRESAAKWITETVQAANPMSDEEPEDNIRQTEKTAVSLFGESVLGIWESGGDGHRRAFTPYDECTTEHKALIDTWTTEN